MWGAAGWLTENAKFILASPPKDYTGAAQTGLWADMSKWGRAAIVIGVGDQTSITPPAVTLVQASDSAGTGSKTLAFDWETDGVTSQLVDAFTRSAVTSNTFNIAATDNNLYIIDIRDSMLDIANGFRYFGCNVASPGSHAFPSFILYILYDGDWSGAVANLPTAVL